MISTPIASRWRRDFELFGESERRPREIARRRGGWCRICGPFPLLLLVSGQLSIFSGQFANSAHSPRTDAEIAEKAIAVLKQLTTDSGQLTNKKNPTIF